MKAKNSLSDSNFSINYISEDSYIIKVKYKKKKV